MFGLYNLDPKTWKRWQGITEPCQRRLTEQQIALCSFWHQHGNHLVSMAAVDAEILVMKYLEQLTTLEIAEALGISERAVRYRHRQALERLTLFPATSDA